MDLPAALRGLLAAGHSVDVINMDCDFSGYKLLVAPMLYMVRPGVAERIEEFVAQEAFLWPLTPPVWWMKATCVSSVVFLDPHAGCWGIWSEEIDSPIRRM